MISPFVYKFLKHVATGGIRGVRGNSALGGVVFNLRGGSRGSNAQGLGMLASRWSTRLHNKGLVWHGSDEYGNPLVTIKPAGLAAIEEYENGQDTPS